MRCAGLSLFVLFSLARGLPASEPTITELRVLEKKLIAANEAAAKCVGCVVVSRSEQYPKPVSAGDVQGVLGAFDPVQFLKDNPRAKPGLAKSLDLSQIENIPDHGFACGVVVDDKGLLLTPYHVIEGATKIYVHLPGRVGSYADIHAADARNDLAVLRLVTPPPGIKAIKFADVRLGARGQQGNISIGKLTVLMANPYASNFPIDKPSAALGHVTNVRRYLPLEGRDKLPRRLDNYYQHGPFLEHDAKLNTGISGAALLNLDGEMIGLTTTGAPTTGSGEKMPEYAFPMTEQLLRVIEVLRRGEEVEGGALGISLGTGSDGVAIGTVQPLGPAAKAGILPFDTITHVNGVEIRNYDDLLGHIGSALAGAKVSLTVRSPRRTQNVDLTLGKWPHERPTIASVRPDPVFGLRVDYESILSQRVDQNRQAIQENIESGFPVGVSVRELAPNSPAAIAFKKLGDDPKRWLITHVNGNAVADPAEFYAAAKGRKAIKLTVIDPIEVKRPQREMNFP